MALMDRYFVFDEKLYTAYVWFANAVASEGSVTNHDKRLVLARMLISPNPPCERFIKEDMIAQGYNADTSQSDIQNRLSALATNLVNLGFGG